MRKLTDRERILIFALMIVLIVGGGAYFVILPMLERNSTLSDRTLELEAEYAEKSMVVASLPALEKEREELTASYNKSVNVFYKPIEHDDAAGLVSRVIISHDLLPESLSLDDPKGVVNPAFGEAAEKADEEEPVAAELLTYEMTAAMRGTFDSFKSFIDEASRNRAFDITGWTVDIAPEGDKEELYSVRLKIFMYENEALQKLG